jgi:hypothetical protein
MTYQSSSSMGLSAWDKCWTVIPSHQVQHNTLPPFPRQPQLLNSRTSINNAVESLWCWPMILDGNIFRNNVDTQHIGSQAPVSSSSSSFSLFDQPAPAPHDEHHCTPKPPLTCANGENSKQTSQFMQRINVNSSPFNHGCICGHNFMYRIYDNTAIKPQSTPFVPRTPVVQIKLR